MGKTFIQNQRTPFASCDAVLAFGAGFGLGRGFALACVLGNAGAEVAPLLLLLGRSAWNEGSIDAGFDLIDEAEIIKQKCCFYEIQMV